jgi:hypothetical protein
VPTIPSNTYSKFLGRVCGFFGKCSKLTCDSPPFVSIAYRSGDRNAKDVPRLLILKTTVQAYAPGSETRRAVTTVSGATKLNVRNQLVTPEGHQMLEHVVAGNVRFIGSNLPTTWHIAWPLL